MCGWTWEFWDLENMWLQSDRLMTQRKLWLGMGGRRNWKSSDAYWFVWQFGTSKGSMVGGGNRIVEVAFDGHYILCSLRSSLSSLSNLHFHSTNSEHNRSGNRPLWCSKTMYQQNSSYLPFPQAERSMVSVNSNSWTNGKPYLRLINIIIVTSTVAAVKIQQTATTMNGSGIPCLSRTASQPHLWCIYCHSRLASKENVCHACITNMTANSIVYAKRWSLIATTRAQTTFLWHHYDPSPTPLWSSST